MAVDGGNGLEQATKALKNAHRQEGRRQMRSSSGSSKPGNGWTHARSKLVRLGAEYVQKSGRDRAEELVGSGGGPAARFFKHCLGPVKADPQTYSAPKGWGVGGILEENKRGRLARG